VSYLEYQVKFVPTGLRKILYLNWPLILLVSATCGIGLLMLYSVSGGDAGTWMTPQLQRFGAGLVLMLTVAMVPIWFWRSMALPAYLLALVLLVAVEVAGSVGMGAQRWLDLGVITIQPSEIAKIALVMVLAAYYDRLPPRRISRPFWVFLPVVITLLPTALILAQPNLGTAVVTVMIGATVMFCAGVHWAYFATVIGGTAAAILAVFESRGASWQLLHDYQYRRIDTFLDPATDPMGAGYNITQATIALGSGGWTGRGFMQGTQSRLNFLPEKHTDFIFNTLAEEFGFVGSLTLLVLYVLILVFCLVAALQQKDRFSFLLILGISTGFFLLFAVNMLMVMGMAPVVGIPLPLVSYGGSALMVLLIAFGLIQSAHVHRPR
jgi:rod shape determining protein RodA